MMQYAVTGQPAAPMPDRISAWALYDVFSVKYGEQIFLAAVSDAQWITFCDALGYADLQADPQLATNNDRVRARPTLLPTLRQRLAAHSTAELTAIFERNGLLFAPILRPEQLFDDPHLNAAGGLADITLPDGERAGQTARTTLFPLRMDGPAAGHAPAAPGAGPAHRRTHGGLGYTGVQVLALQAQGGGWPDSSSCTTAHNDTRLTMAVLFALIRGVLMRLSGTGKKRSASERWGKAGGVAGA
jgi:crotonobetainyl-CoA:carnitine CoA-transferase CaiB-like acyl-CoA transferase